MWFYLSSRFPRRSRPNDLPNDSQGTVKPPLELAELSSGHRRPSYRMYNDRSHQGRPVARALIHLHLRIQLGHHQQDDVDENGRAHSDMG